MLQRVDVDCFSSAFPFLRGKKASDLLTGRHWQVIPCEAFHDIARLFDADFAQFVDFELGLRSNAVRTLLDRVVLVQCFAHKE